LCISWICFVILIIRTEMNNTEFANAKHAKCTHQYKNKKEKLHKMNANIWFNKLCKAYNVTPKYIRGDEQKR
jgi:hypothetical protein